VKNARNGLLPGLNLSADVGAANVAGTPAPHISSETLDYGAGVTLDLPVDRLAERNSYRAALIRFQQSQRAYVAQKDQIAIDVREALRTIRAAEVSVEIQRQNVELAERRLEFANELLRQGKREARDVVEAQSALLDAQDSYEGARRRLQIQVLEFMRDTGTLRVDPEAGAIGRAMDRTDGGQREDVPAIE
jgi:outer membrane protein TolC